MKLVLGAAAVALGGLLLLDLVNLGHPTLDPVAHMASFFVHGYAGWLLVVAGVGIAGTGFAFLPMVLGRGRVVAAAVAVFGTGVAVAAVVPTQPYGNWDRPQSTATLVHGVAALVAFVALPVAALAAHRAWRGLPLPRVRTGLAVASTVLTLLLFAGMAEVADGPDHLGHVLGLLERLMIVADVCWLAASAVAIRWRAPVAA